MLANTPDVWGGPGPVEVDVPTGEEVAGLPTYVKHSGWDTDHAVVGWSYTPPSFTCPGCQEHDVVVEEVTVTGGLTGLVWTMACLGCGYRRLYPATAQGAQA